ncbi:MAG TPA: S8 family serine peptidase [Flavobacteriales bacterium]|jgi:subtilisin family serine protease|nr:S8 family serine peptidase [Flavobacteriales bacterium]
MRIKKTLFFIIISFSSFAQQDSITYKYWVEFTDKYNSNFSVNNPELFLSQRAIERRVRQNIPIKIQDLPINNWYVDSIINLGFDVLNRSKWFNGIMLSTNDSNLVDNINFSFVKSTFSFGRWNRNKSNQRTNSKFENDFNKSDYGDTYNQLQMLKGNILHNRNLKGEGKVIAVLDAGFSKANEMDAFKKLFDEDRILGSWDFVAQEESVFEDHSHGMMVLSTMGAENKGQIIGTSPNASFWLLRSEDGDTENLIEEYNWLCAAEFADSVGADIINSSLGYTTFDDVNQNHTYSDMDGRTAPVSIAANLASRKGMIVVNSAGNSGSSSWHYIGAPADADSILSVGAVDENRDFAWFSSYGPSIDGRIKPTVVAQGRNTIVATSDNGILAGNGTSFSSPVIAGMTACLWQAHPNRTNIEIINAIILSANLHDNPNDSLGYGLPNYDLADQLLTFPKEQNLNGLISVSPNPITTKSALIINMEGFNGSLFYYKDLLIEVYDIRGKKVHNNDYIVTPLSYNQVHFSFLEKISAGTYFLKIQIAQQEFLEKVIVID